MQVRERKIRLRREIRDAVRMAFVDVSERRNVEGKLVAGLDMVIRNSRISSDRGIWAFWPTLPEEPDFRDWLTGLMVSGIKIGLPRLNWEDRSLEFRQVSDPVRELEFDGKGLAQPRIDLPDSGADTVAVILVPGLAFDLQGGRLGRGAGFYDRTLAKVPESVLRIGVCYDQQVVDEVPQDSWDRKVHAILSPDKGLRECRDVRAGRNVSYES